MLFRFLAALCFWPHISWTNAFWAALGGTATWLLKKLWDVWSERAWLVFKTTFVAGFKNTPGGKAFLENFYKAKAEKDAELVKEHPELEKVLKCKVCGGKGCDDCGGTGWD